MNTSNSKKSLEDSKEQKENKQSETFSITFVTEAGEEFATIDLTKNEYEFLEKRAEEEGLSLEEFINMMLWKVAKLDETEEIDA